VTELEALSTATLNVKAFKRKRYRQANREKVAAECLA